jgi:predicted homoserine dehydrogenase-like protein
VRERLRVGVVGVGKFASMFLSRVRALPDVEIVGVADLSLERARAALRRVGWNDAKTQVTDDALALIARGDLDLLVEATGSPDAAVTHALAAFGEGCHVVNVTVEADGLVGPLLAERARAAGVVYSLAYGDQPALICELVDWAHTCGLEVVCAGKGTKYLPEYHSITPDTVWEHYGLDRRHADREGLNARMFASFVDGTKSAVEMAAVANATGFAPQAHGLGYPPCGTGSLPSILRPEAAGGTLTRTPTVEVVSSLERDGRPVAGDLRWGVFVVFEGADDYVRGCFAEYGLATDESGRYAVLYRPNHLIGLELAVSVVRVGFQGRATGAPSRFCADVAATAKRDLEAGTTLDGEGGYCLYGSLLPAALSLERGVLPIGLADGLALLRDVAAGELVLWADVETGGSGDLLRLRRELEHRFRSGFAEPLGGKSYLGPTERRDS